MNKFWILLVIVLVVAFGTVYFSGDSENEVIVDEPSESDNLNEEVSGVDDVSDEGSVDDVSNIDTEENVVENSVKVFVLTGENFKFIMDGETNPDIRVNEGDTVRIEFSSTQGTHNWKISEFSASTSTVSTYESMTSVEFVADKKGTFEYYCSVGQHRAYGMEGNLIVE